MIKGLENICALVYFCSAKLSGQTKSSFLACLTIIGLVIGLKPNF
jgi:hypothetical protein